MAAVGGGAVRDLCEEATCSICLDYFSDPVTTECGHNFCRGCLSQCWREPETEASCPQCRLAFRGGSVIPNRPLANFVEITKKLSLQGRRGPEGVCGEHQEPLKLFCRTDETPICVVCDRSREHRQHQVIPAEEAAQEYQDQIYSCLENLRKDQDKFLASKAVIEKESQDLLKATEAKRGKVVSKFREVHQFLEDQEKLLLSQIEEEEKEIIIKREEHLARLSRELSLLGHLIQEMEEKCHQPASELLQDIGRTLKKTEKREKFSNIELVSPVLKGKISEIYYINLFLEDVMKKFKDLFLERKKVEKAERNIGELQTETTVIRVPFKIPTWEDVLLSGSPPQKVPFPTLFTADITEPLSISITPVNVTLAPDTAFTRLILSEDLKSVRWDKKCQDRPENPARFDLCPFVLGVQEFSAGRYYWDISVGSEEQWAVGVARKSVKRKGPLTFGPDCGIWAIGKSEGEYKAFIPPHNPRLCLNGKLKKIRVFVNCAEGQVAFYNVDTEDLLYRFFRASFAGQPIVPFFRVFLGGYLRISL